METGTLLVYVWGPFKLLGRPGDSALFNQRTALTTLGRRTWVYRNPAGTPSPGTLVCTYAPLHCQPTCGRHWGLHQLQFPGSTDTREGFALSTMFPRLALISTFIIRTSMLCLTRSSTCASTLSVYASMFSLSTCASTLVAPGPPKRNNRRKSANVSERTLHDVNHDNQR